MSDEQQAFEQLVKRVKLGDRQAISELISRYEREVAMVARVRLGHALRPYFDESDILQSVHRSVLLGVRDEKLELRSPKALVGLAATIARRKVARKWRQLRRQHRLSGINQSTEGTEVPDVLAKFESPLNDPQRIAALREQFANVLQQMDDVDQELIRLRLDGFRTTEAAEQLGLNPNVARVRLSRLRKKLADANLDTPLL